MHGLCWLVIVAFSSVTAAGLIDWALHLNDPGVRLILALSIVGGSSYIAWRHLISPLRFALTDVDIALKVEQRFPSLKDSLSSTIQFLRDDADARLGSPDMQHRVIEQTLAKLDQVDVSEIVDTRAFTQVATAAFITCVMTAGIVGLNQANAATALNRLAFPFSDVQWPKQCDLRLVNEAVEAIEFDPGDPLRIARGDTLEIFVQNLNGTIPRDARIEFRFSDGNVFNNALKRQSLTDVDGRSVEVGVTTLVASKGPIEFRAIGGDDQEMPWYQLLVVPAPKVEQLQVRVTPPAYSKLSVRELPKGVGHVQGLVGSEIELLATISKPLRSAVLNIKDTAHPIDVSENGRQLSTKFTISEAGVYSYWFALTDQQGFESRSPKRFEIRGIADIVPDVFFETPTTDVYVTADAEIPLRIGAKDDLGLRQLQLKYQFKQGPEASAESKTITTTIPLFEAGIDEKLQEQIAVDHSWNLAELNLPLGAQLTFHAEATDDYDLGDPHVGRSLTHTITIISKEEKIAELSERQAAILEEIERATKTQTQTNRQVKELSVQLDTIGKLRPEDLDILKRAELDQRQVGSRLINPADGVGKRIDDVLKELEQNKIEDEATQNRLGQMSAELELLQSEYLPKIEQQLTQARKIAQTEDSKKTPRDELAETNHAQTAVLESLGAMQQLLSKWRTNSELTSELSEVAASQKKLNEESAKLGQRTLSKPLSRLGAQDQADLAKLRDRQMQQADRLDRFRKRLKETAEEISEIDPESADALLSTVDELERAGLSGRMREVGEQLGRNQVGQAAPQQQEILIELEALGDVLQDRSSQDSEMLVKQMKKAEDELANLRKKQDELMRKTRDTEQNPNDEERERELERLRKEQQQLRSEVDAMARRLQRLQARRAGESARRASSRMQQAGAALDQNQGEQAAVEQQDALDDLEQAARELGQAREEAEEQLAFEQFEKIASEIKSMIDRQQNVIDETIRIDKSHQERIKAEGKPPTSWKRSESASLRRLADVERGLQKETETLAKSIESAEVFALALRGAARLMNKAADRIADKKPDEQTVSYEKAAKNRFVKLVQTLASANQDENAAQAEGGQGQPGGDEGPPGDSIPRIAEVKMLIALQIDLNQRTVDLDKRRQNTEDAEEQQEIESEIAEIAEEQSTLADLARNLTETTSEEAFDAELESLPDNQDGDQ